MQIEQFNIQSSRPTGRVNNKTRKETEETSLSLEISDKSSFSAAQSLDATAQPKVLQLTLRKKCCRRPLPVTLWHTDDLRYSGVFFLLLFFHFTADRKKVHLSLTIRFGISAQTHVTLASQQNPLSKKTTNKLNYNIIHDNMYNIERVTLLNRA